MDEEGEVSGWLDTYTERREVSVRPLGSVHIDSIRREFFHTLAGHPVVILRDLRGYSFSDGYPPTIGRHTHIP